MVGIVITMFDEFDVVSTTIKNCSSYETKIVVVHSDNEKTDENLEFIKDNSTYILLPNLGKVLHKYEVPSASVCRNYNAGFEKLYELWSGFDFVIGITGDSLITDLNKILNLTKSGHIGYVLQAIGQSFWDRNDNPLTDKPTRLQTNEITDIMPQFFVFDGKFSYDNKLFTQIINANTHTSEENLGNEIVRVLGNEFKVKIKRIHNHPYVYAYNEGINLQIKGLGHTRK